MTLDDFLSSLISEQIIFFPIRHHSPACSWHLQRLINEIKPIAVLVEGPEEMTSLIPFMLHEKTRTPFAVYTTYVDLSKQFCNVIEDSFGAPRFAGYYPFCDYSPELVALQAGRAVGAVLKFIDLSYPEQVINENSREKVSQRRRYLLDEAHLQHSRYLKELAHRAGCRDQNELWDHLFEANFQSISTENFIHNVASYCYFSRMEYSEDMLKLDGTDAREQAMAAAIFRELTEQSKVIVVTGGFHTVTLPHLVASQKKSTKTEYRRFKDEETQLSLMRYSFDQLDALNGYASGMPSPAYYQQFWVELQNQVDNPYTKTAAKFLIEIGRLTQKNYSKFLSTADQIAALEQALVLANFRSHIGPTREDLLDAVRSCFVKGSMDIEGNILLEAVKRLLAGDSIGEVPLEAGTPPIVEDFKRMTKLLKLKIEDSAPKEVALDIYRKLIHRRSSRFFHSLLFLQIPFARPLAMPDFVMGKDLDRIQESWEYRWSPRTESSLIERSLYGSTIEEAAINYLCEKLDEFTSEARDRNSIEGVRMLIAACRMGLHSYTDRIVDLIEISIGEDPSFISLSESMIQLTLLWDGREPMQAHSLKSIPILAAAAYRRACYLIPTLCNTLKKDADAVVRALCNMREMLFSWSREVFDSELFIDKLKENYLQSTGEPIVVGAITGILFGLNQIDEKELILSTYFKNMGNLLEVGYLEGLLKSCKELAWNRVLLELIDRELGSYDEKDFMNTLPQMRLAFSLLTPRETDRVAEIVARICLQDSADETITNFLADDDILTAAKVDEEVRLLLLHDYLDDFLN